MGTFSEVADIYPFHHIIDGAGTHGSRDDHTQLSQTPGVFLTDDGLQEALQLEIQRG